MNKKILEHHLFIILKKKIKLFQFWKNHFVWSVLQIEKFSFHLNLQANNFEKMVEKLTRVRIGENWSNRKQYFCNS